MKMSAEQKNKTREENYDLSHTVICYFLNAENASYLNAYAPQWFTSHAVI